MKLPIMICARLDDISLFISYQIQDVTLRSVGIFFIPKYFGDLVSKQQQFPRSSKPRSFTCVQEFIFM
jgi:hypothetical protein